MLNHILRLLLLILWCVQVCGEGVLAIHHHEQLNVHGEEAQGVMKGTITHFKLPELPLERTFFHNCAVYGAKAAGYVGAKAIFYGRDAFRDLHKDAAQVVMQSLCADLCKDIGKAYKSVDAAGNVIDGKLDYLSHKVLHAFTGALGQAVKGPEGMLAGAAGGALGEILGEHFTFVNRAIAQVRQENPTLSPDDGRRWLNLVMNQIKDQHDMLQAITGSLAAFMGLDGHAAKEAAQMAMENNSAGVVKLLAMGVLVESAVLSRKGVQAVQAFLRTAPVLYKVGKDAHNKGQQQAKEEQQKPSSEGSGSGGEDPGERKKNCEKQDSPVWKNLKPYKGKTKTDAKGRKYQWDHTHKNIEVYNKDFKHVGSMDPKTGKMYKPAVIGRKMRL